MADDKRKILIVDDEPSIRDFLKFRFEAINFDVITASDGKTAIVKAQDETPDVILLDLMMPEMDGYEVYKRLKENLKTKRIPIIVFTARGAEDVAGLGPEAMDVVDYVVKPFDDKVLEVLVKSVVKLSNL